MDFTVIGNSVNIASRLCSAALGGEIVIDESSFRLSKRPAEGVLEPLRIKGKSHPVDVRRLSATAKTMFA